MKKVAASVLLLVIAALAQSHHFERMRSPSGVGICGHCGAPENPPATITIAPSSEPGERMVITGTVYRADGKTPAEGVTLLLYHTDATGLYNADDDAFQPRLYGYLKTGRDGRYEIRSIKPAPYPHRTQPAHIHVHAFGPKLAERTLPDYWFYGDPYLKPSDLAAHKDEGEFSPIVRLTRGSDGVLHGVRNLRLSE